MEWRKLSREFKVRLWDCSISGSEASLQECNIRASLTIRLSYWGDIGLWHINLSDVSAVAEL